MHNVGRMIEGKGVSLRYKGGWMGIGLDCYAKMVVEIALYE